MGDPTIDFIMNNFFTIYLLFFNIFLIFVIIRLRVVLGPFFNQSLKVGFGLMKDPNMFLHFLNSKVAVMEWRPYKTVIKLDPEDPTSELIYVDRQNGFAPATTIRPRYARGFLNIFGFGKKLSPIDDANTFYSDEIVPVKLNPGNFYMFGRQMHVIYEGQNTTQNPLAEFSQDAQVKKAGIAVEHQLIANKLLAESEFRNKMATRDDVRNWGMINLAILGIGIIALIVMVIGLQSAVETFAKFAGDTYESYRPAIEAFFNSVPRVVQG